jgi:GNAT superfamily N-acetyltransferase
MRYGPEYAVVATLSDGTNIQVRPVQPSDREPLREAFRRLSPESRYRRFFAVLSDLSDEMLTYMTCVDGTDHVAFVAVVESADLKTERGVGIARFVRVPDKPTMAEAAVTVVDDMQRRGVGRILTLTLAGAARERGIVHFSGEVLASNAPMLEALRQSNATLEATSEGTVRFVVPIAPDNEPMILRLLSLAARSMTVFLSSLSFLWPKRPAGRAP